MVFCPLPTKILNIHLKPDGGYAERSHTLRGSLPFEGTCELTCSLHERGKWSRSVTEEEIILGPGETEKGKI